MSLVVSVKHFLVHKPAEQQIEWDWYDNGRFEELTKQ